MNVNAEDNVISVGSLNENETRSGPSTTGLIGCDQSIALTVDLHPTLPSSPTQQRRHDITGVERRGAWKERQVGTRVRFESREEQMVGENP